MYFKNTYLNAIFVKSFFSLFPRILFNKPLNGFLQTRNFCTWELSKTNYKVNGDAESPRRVKNRIIDFHPNLITQCKFESHVISFWELPRARLTTTLFWLSLLIKHPKFKKNPSSSFGNKIIHSKKVRKFQQFFHSVTRNKNCEWRIKCCYEPHFT